MAFIYVSQQIGNDGNTGESGSPFATIGAALAIAQPNDTVIVGDGTYHENLLVADEGVTLISENGRDTTTIVGSNASTLLGTIQIAPNVHNVTIGAIGQGFTIIGIDGTPGLEKAAVYLQGAHNNLTIQGNEIVANGDAGLTSEYGYAITNSLIDSNIFSGQTFNGSNPAGDGFGEQFTLPNVPRQLVLLGSNNGPSNNITFTNNDVTGSAGGLNSNGDPQGNTLVTIDADNSTIEANNFTGFTNRFATQLRAREENTDITNNTFSNDQGGNLGVYVENDGNPGSYAGNTFLTDGSNPIADTPGNDTINGGDGDDTILAGPGNDNIDGGDGNDTYDMTAAGSGGSFVDLQSNLAFSSGTGIDTLSNVENVRGSAGADGLYGNVGNNVFYATAGADTIDGRGGSDTFDASNATTMVNINLATGTASGAFTASLTSIENAIGGTGNDQFFGSSAANTFDGNAGTDTFSNLGDGDFVDGGSESDTAVFTANFEDAIITAGEAGTYTVTIGGATVTLTGVEQLQFADTLVHIVGTEAGVSDYQSIQDAIDNAAPGDTVFVLKGTYEEQVVISKNLTLAGEGDGTIIKAPDGPIEALSGRASIITANNAANVSIQNIQVDGEGRGNELASGAGDFHGIAYINAGGTVENVTVTGIRMPLDENDNVSGIQQGRAIYANNTGPTEYTLDVIGNTVTDFQKNGIDLRGNLTVTVTENTVTGNGWTPTNAQNGIAVVGGVEGTISSNIVTEVGYVDTPANAAAVSAGILNHTSNVTIDGNTITAPAGTVDAPGVPSASGANSAGDANGSIITNNTISGFSEAIVSSGDGGNPAVTGNTLNGNAVNLSTFDATAPVSIDGTDGIDELAGGAGNDTLDGGAGNDVIDGDGGFDTIDMSGTDFADVTFGWNDTDGVFTVTTESGGTDQVTNVEKVDLLDKDVWLVTDSAGLTAALAAAGEGDVIKLAPGDYAGNFTIAVDGLTIESVTGNAADVVFEGTFKSSNGIDADTTVGDWLETAVSYTGSAGNALTISADNVTLKNLTISKYLTGIELGHNSGLTIEGVNVDNSVNGIRKGTAAVVADFTMIGGTISDGYIGFNIAAAVGAGAFDNVLIDGATFQHMTEKGIYAEQLSNAQLLNLVMNDVGQFGRGPAFGGVGPNAGEYGSGIDINLKYGDYSNITISDFNFTDVGSSLGGDATPGTFGGAIAIKARDDGPSYNANPATLDGVTIEDGSINGTSTGIRIGEPGKTNNGPTNVEVTNVAIENASNGSYDNRTSVALEVELTDGNDVAVTNPSATGPIHFTGGEGNDTIVGGGGLDEARYAGPIDAAAGITFDKVTGTWSVSAGAEGTDTLKDIEIVDGAESGRILLVGGDGFATLQAAVNAAQDGDTIVLASGSFVGDVTISDKALTILGVNNDGIGGDGTRGDESSIVGRVTVTGTKNVTFDGVEFRATASTGTTGPGNGALNLKGSGIYLIQNSVFYNETQGGNNESRGVMMDSSFTGTATISNNLFTGAHHNNFSTASWQRGIWSDGNAADLNITGNRFEYTRSAINLDGYDDATHEVSGNVFAEAGSGISIGVPKTNTYSGIHDNDFQLVSAMVIGVPQGETAFNFQNVTTPVVLDLSATNNESSTDDVILVRGGANADKITGSDGTDILVGNAGADDLDGGGGNDVILGGAGNDTITGGDGDDIIDGGLDDDTIIAGGGSDTVEGGDGTDTYVLSGDFADYTITYDSSTQTYSIIDGVDTNTVHGVEKFQFGTDVVDVTGNPNAIVTNMAPVVTGIIEQGVDEDSNASTIQVSEAAVAPLLVGKISATDPNLTAGDSLTFTLVEDGNPDQLYVGPFTLVQADNGTAFLFLTGALNYETAASHNLMVKITDSAGNSVTQGFTVGVLNENEAPTAIHLSAQTVEEGVEGQNIGIVTIDDPDNNVTSVAVSDSRFEVVNIGGGILTLRLKAGEALDYETEPQVDLTITATDAGGLSKAQDFTISVQNANEPPQGAGLAQEVTLEQGSTRFALGLTQVVDPEGDTLTYTVQTLPMQGTLFNGNTALAVGAVLTGAQFAALTYTASDTSDTDQQIQFGVSDGTTTASLVVNIEVTPASNDTKTGDANINRLDGAAGDDTLYGLGGNDILIGGVGNDTLDGGADADEMRGGKGDDTYIVDNIGDKVFETKDEGIDTVRSSVTFSLAGQNLENLELTGSGNINGTGNSLANILTGNAGNNTLNGGTGADQMRGGRGDDTYIVDNIGDKVFETKDQGIDTVRSSVTFSLAGQNLENLELTGNGNINGTGNSLANIIVGNSGNNVINGGTGKDDLTGGAGNDTFVFASASHTAAGSANRDVVRDFKAGGDLDIIDLSGFSGTLKFSSESSFSGAVREVIAVQQGADVLLQINTGGDTTPEAEILLTNLLRSQISASDFML